MAEPIIVHTDVGLGIRKTEYHDPDSHELPTDSILLVSEPPSGGYKIYNIWGVLTGDKLHLEVERKDTPEP